VSLAGLAGHTVVLTFLDPVCTSDCPLIAQELRITDQMIGRDATHVVLVAIVANPLYRSTASTTAFTKQEGLEHLSNWHFVTGPLSQLENAWNSYGIEAAVSPAGAMVAHSDLVYVIDRTGRLRVVLNADLGGLGESALHSSFSTLLAAQVQDVVHS
jgi:cytochrome oxidase Cu insertion factor (SCO1/SenC/PrrC family)